MAVIYVEAPCGRERNRRPRRARFSHAGVMEREPAAEIPSAARDLYSHKRKRPLAMNERPLFMSATTYSPTHFRVQYNRPGGA